ncbi:ABC transporter substrate-binding protein [Actinomadura rudentiformis]|uniref:ABC transporter substrate-binding protein n=1 Tax=Actinomadura rudentiformis TaxID=359158 RepID=A0A6H9YYE5_9ACTN|nr:ABC transporter substrate-binding protein [Actinomadura rudentiformis]KAB2345274.1 ABC transporter substrate-binding protein [Actinomadura rudentiformis]
MKFGRIRRVLGAGLVGILAAGLIAGCSDSDDPAGDGELEKSTLNIGALPIPYSAPVYLAQQKGFFKEEGLTVKTEVFAGGAAALPKLLGGNIDVMVSNHVTAISTTAKGNKLRILAEIDLGVEKELPVLVAKDSPIRTPADLKGKKIALNTLRNLGELTVTSALATAGVDVKKDDVQFVEMPFPGMVAALEKKSVDAIWVAEPFLTDAQKKLGARPVLDSLSGATKDLPLDGYVATDAFVKKNPKTVAAFKRAIGRAQALAAQDRNAVVNILPSFAKIDKNTASSIVIGPFVTSTSETRLQRVADLMLQYGFLQQKFDIKTVL